MDGDLGIVIEPDSLPADIYPYVKIEEAEEAACGGVKGSCATFRIELSTKYREMLTPFGEGPSYDLLLVDSAYWRVQKISRNIVDSSTSERGRRWPRG